MIDSCTGQHMRHVCVLVVLIVAVCLFFSLCRGFVCCHSERACARLAPRRRGLVAVCVYDCVLLSLLLGPRWMRLMRTYTAGNRSCRADKLLIATELCTVGCGLCRP